MRRYLYILFLVIILIGCRSKTDRPILDNSNFSDYVPWWATNNSMETLSYGSPK